MTLPETIRTSAFVDGKFVDALDGATFDTFAPATGEVIARVAACGPDDIDRAVSAARAAFDGGEWSRLAPAERKAVLLRFADLVEAYAEELARTEAVDAQADHGLPRVRPARRAHHLPLVRPKPRTRCSARCPRPAPTTSG
jgi:delta 1-pyrroline-5-carboxylate dehydrogenase